MLFRIHNLYRYVPEIQTSLSLPEAEAQKIIKGITSQKLAKAGLFF